MIFLYLFISFVDYILTMSKEHSSFDTHIALFKSIICHICHCCHIITVMTDDGDDI